MRRVLQLAALGAVLTFAAKADTVVMDFNGLVNPTTGVANGDEVLQYFNGGQDYLHNNGPDDGVYFSSIAETFSNPAAGNGTGIGEFGGDPDGNTALTFVSSSSVPATMDVPAGFTSFSFYYSSPTDSPTIFFYTELDGTGSDYFQSLSLPATGGGVGTSGCLAGYDVDCPFVLATVSLTQTAESVNFITTENAVVFGDFTLQTAVSEPGAFKMLGLGLASLLAVSRRQRRLQEAIRRLRS